MLEVRELHWKRPKKLREPDSKLDCGITASSGVSWVVQNMILVSWFLKGKNIYITMKVVIHTYRFIVIHKEVCPPSKEHPSPSFGNLSLSQFPL